MYNIICTYTRVYHRSLSISVYVCVCACARPIYMSLLRYTKLLSDQKTSIHKYTCAHTHAHTNTHAHTHKRAFVGLYVGPVWSFRTFFHNNAHAIGTFWCVYNTRVSTRAHSHTHAYTHAHKAIFILHVCVCVMRAFVPLLYAYIRSTCIVEGAVAAAAADGKTTRGGR